TVATASAENLAPTADRMLAACIVLRALIALADNGARTPSQQDAAPERVLAVAAASGVVEQDFQVGLNLDGLAPAIDVQPDRLFEADHLGRQPNRQRPLASPEEVGVVLQNLAVEVHRPGAARERPLAGVDASTARHIEHFRPPEVIVPFAERADV